MNNQDKKEDTKQEKINLHSEEETEGKECPHCYTLNEHEAKFCSECGYDFTGVKHCHKCGTRIVSPNADICEVCGEWLLEGKCKFCYADIEEGQTYCAECGNPVAGVVCPQCGRLSCFDFCKHCNIPLTAMANNMLEKVKQNIDQEPEKFQSNQEARAYYMAQQYLNLQKSKQTDKVPSETEQLLKLKKYLEKVNNKDKKKKAFTPLFSEKQKKSIKSIGEIADKELERQEMERKKQEEERRRKEEEERKRRQRGWRCNAYGALHPGGPCDCADPSQGGYWENSDEG